MNFLLILLGVMAVVIGSVGSIALSGALSLSVMERRREIGVMRAIGASSWTIFRLFIGEGLILGWLSWLIAFPLSIPVGRGMSQAIGSVLQSDLFYTFSPVGHDTVHCCQWAAGTRSNQNQRAGKLGLPVTAYK
jgi:putative ABC transport system permease protein